MIRLEAEIDIAAPPEEVWRALTGFAAYPEWNPLLLEVRGAAEAGARLRVRVTAPNGSGVRYWFRARVVGFEPGRLFAWKGGVRGILLGVHYWRLAPSAAGTRLVHGEDFSGVVPWLMGRKRILSFRPAYEGMNRALAERISASRNAT